MRIPIVVLKEVANRYSELLGELTKGANSLGITLSNPDFDVTRGSDETREAYEDYLRNLITKAGGTILDYPNVSHDSLVNRAINVSRPFQEKDKGYRDTLIWYSVLDLAKQNKEKVAFISNDKGFQSESGGLHPHLQKDLRENQINLETVELYTAINDFVDTHIRPWLETQDEIVKELARPENKVLNLLDFLSSGFNEFIKGDSVAIDETLFFLEDLTIDFIDEVVDIDFDSIQAVKGPEENIVVINLEFTARVSANAMIPKDDVYRIREFFPGTVWISQDWNEYYDYVGLSLTANLGVEFSLNIKNHKVIGAQILDVDLSNYLEREW